jgi:hypothetical protein
MKMLNSGSDQVRRQRSGCGQCIIDRTHKSATQEKMPLKSNDGSKKKLILNIYHGQRKTVTRCKDKKIIFIKYTTKYRKLAVIRVSRCRRAVPCDWLPEAAGMPHARPGRQ